MALSSSSGSELRCSADEGPDWSELPPELTLTILGKLCPLDLLEKAPMVCRTWRNISKDPSLWRSIDSFRFNVNSTLTKNMRRAIDLSCGQLVDATIEGSETLEYVADRANQLKRLEIHGCNSDVLKKALRNLPLLEELHVHDQRIKNKKVVETIESCCPNLKKLITYRRKLITYRRWPRR